MPSVSIWISPSLSVSIVDMWIIKILLLFIPFYFLCVRQNEHNQNNNNDNNNKKVIYGLFVYSNNWLQVVVFSLDILFIFYFTLYLSIPFVNGPMFTFRRLVLGVVCLKLFSCQFCVSQMHCECMNEYSPLSAEGRSKHLKSNMAHPAHTEY